MSVVIDFNNSYSRITGLTASQYGELRKILSYKTNPQSAYFAGGFSKTRYLIDNKGNFPTGLYSRVCKYLFSSNIDFVCHESTPNITGVNHKPNFKGINLHKWQIKAADAFSLKNRGTISACTGSGKSLLMALIITRLNVRTLVVVPTLELKKQLTESLLERFNDMSNIVVENIDSNKLKTFKNFDLLVIDEAHHVAAKTYHKLNKTAWNDIYYRLCLTATAFRNNEEETLLFEAIAGNVIYKLSYIEAIREGYIVPVEAYYIEMPKTTNNYYTWAEVYNNLIVNNKKRNEVIYSLLSNFSEAGLSTLCLVKEIKHGENLLKIGTGWFSNGQEEESKIGIKAFSEGRLKALIATTGVAGEGVDTRACEYVIIAGLGKAKSAFMQQVGRCVRKYKGKVSGKVILILDRSHKFTLRHFNEQRKILKEEFGVELVKLEVL